jgi:DNA-binding transcriptional ArsR family regulator
MALPSVMKHLDVLSEAGVVRSKKAGRVRTYELETRALSAIDRWVSSRRSAMNARFDRLERMLAEEDD